MPLRRRPADGVDGSAAADHLRLARRKVVADLEADVAGGVQHAAAAQEVGLTAEEIDRTTADSVDGWNPDDALLLRAVDELHQNHGWSDGTWKELAEAFDTRQIMDLLFTVGAYDTLAVAFNCFELPLDPELEGKGFPAEAEG